MELTITEFVIGILSTNLVRYFTIAGFLFFFVFFKKKWVPKKNSKSVSKKSRLLQRNRLLFVEPIYFYVGSTSGHTFSVRRI